MSELETYIVYEVQYKDKIVYIGSGKPTRLEHVKSGKSHVVELNRLFFVDPDNVTVTVIRDSLTKDESIELEKSYIQATEPEFNKQFTRRVRKNKYRVM